MKDIQEGRMKLFRSVCIMTLPDIERWTRRFKLFKIFIHGFKHTSPGNCLMCLTVEFIRYPHTVDK